MKLALDRYAHLKSPLHRWEPRAKLVGLMALIFAFAGVRQLPLLPAMLAIALSLLALSRLPLAFALSRLRYPGLFIAVLVVLLPFTAGETVLWQWGSVTLRQEGLLAVVLIATRLLCILTLSLVLFGTMPFVTTLKAMRSLGLPSVLVDMALLAYRYLEELGTTRQQLQRAMHLRGFRGDRLNRRNLQRLASLAGSLLVRSYERSQHVYQAMILRGYGQGPGARDRRWQGIDRYSWAVSGLMVAIALSLLLAEIWLAEANPLPQ
ncbi:MAG: cobalt ECF transporter T component CbiQ [Spirulinaceae cyanobacterium SM2_1_0]|nr:cobalt ECF transporter T component CbiQ [Spirulinaceae cyanobacterium SM2_1_0]